MSSLINQKIKDTYEGLIKTSDDQPIDGTLKNLQDGNGGVLPIQVSTSGVNFTGTVTGIASGGLVVGTGTDSLQNAVGTASTASGDASIALGKGAAASGDGAVAFGQQTSAAQAGAIALGDSAIAGGINNISIGTSNNTNGADIINIGDNNDMSSYSDRSVLIRPGGGTGIAFRGESVTIGDDTYPGAAGVAIGKSARGKNNNPNVAIGKDAEAGNTGIAIGQDADASGNGSAALGAFSIANGVGAIALGSVSATTVDTVTMKLLQILNYATMSFADDAAAATGGIPLGGVYHTAGALKIRIA